MNVTTPTSTYPINMFDSDGTQALRQTNQAQALVPAAEANEKSAIADDNQSTTSQFNDENTTSTNDGTESPANSETAVDAKQKQAEQKTIEELKARDREVRAHELAHARVGGQYAGAPTYEFQYGPDGRRYAVGGEVQIDISKESSPEKTLQKMEQVIASAMAPQQPSAQDIRVANQARQIASEARAELSAERMSPEKKVEGQPESQVQPVIHLHRESLAQRETLATEAVSESVGLASESQPVSQSVGLASDSQPVSQSVGLASDTQPVTNAVSARYSQNVVDVGSQFTQSA